jgi:hypothetical protein
VKGNQHSHIHRGSLTVKVGIATRVYHKSTKRKQREQDKRYPYPATGAAARTSLPAALLSALPNSDVVDETRLANRAKHPMRVSKLSACRSFERGWATNPKGKDVSVVERGWAGNSKGWDGWQVGHVSNFTARNITVSDDYVAPLTHNNSSTGKPCTWCG